MPFTVCLLVLFADNLCRLFDALVTASSQNAGKLVFRHSVGRCVDGSPKIFLNSLIIENIADN